MKKIFSIILIIPLFSCVSNEELTSTCQAEGKALGSKEMNDCVNNLRNKFVVNTVPPSIYEQSNKQAEAACILYGFKKETERFNYCKTIVLKSEIDKYKQKNRDNFAQSVDNYTKLQQANQSIYNNSSGFTCHHMGTFTTCN